MSSGREHVVAGADGRALPWLVQDVMLLPGEGGQRLDSGEAAAHLRSRWACAAVLDGVHLGAPGTLVVRLATTPDGRCLVADPAGDVHRGPAIDELVSGLAHHLRARKLGEDGSALGQGGPTSDDVSALVEPTTLRTVTIWRDGRDLLAKMLAAEIGAVGHTYLVDGWVVTDWGAAAVPADPLALPRRHHPVVVMSRSGDLRSVGLAPEPGAEQLGLTWAPPPMSVLTARGDTPAGLIETELVEVKVAEQADGPDDWPDGLDPALRPRLVGIQHGAGASFLVEAAAALGVPAIAGRLAEDVRGELGRVLDGARAPTRVQGRSAAQVAWESVRAPLPETAAERRLREQPAWVVALRLTVSLAAAAALAVGAVTLRLRFAPGWVLWVLSGFLIFEVVSTLQIRRGRRPGTSATGSPGEPRLGQRSSQTTPPTGDPDTPEAPATPDT